MDELVRWLGEQLDEDERIARAAAHATGDGDPDAVSVIHASTADEESVAEHIARHDPERVLREIDSKRRLLRSYEDLVAEFNSSGPAMVAYDRLTGSVSALRHAVELLALPYADRPGYREDWRP